MDLGAKFQNPLGKTSLCGQQDPPHHPPVPDLLLVFARHGGWVTTDRNVLSLRTPLVGELGCPRPAPRCPFLLLHPERWQWLQRGPPARSPSPELVLPSLNPLNPQRLPEAKTGDDVFCSLPILLPRVPKASHTRWASYPFTLPMPNAVFLKACLALVPSYSILSKLISSWSQSQVSCLQDRFCPRTMCLRRKVIVFSFYCYSFQVSAYVTQTLQCILAALC